MKNPSSDIANLMKHILGTDVKIKSFEGDFLKESKKFFCKFIDHLDKFELKSHNLAKEHNLDIDPMIEDLYVALDYLILFTFDDEVAEIVQHYLYGRDEKGYVKYVFENKDIMVNTPEKLFDFMVKLGERMAQGDDMD